jgi:hypothetical protein
MWLSMVMYGEFKKADVPYLILPGNHQSVFPQELFLHFLVFHFATCPAYRNPLDFTAVTTQGNFCLSRGFAIFIITHCSLYSFEVPIIVIT